MKGLGMRDDQLIFMISLPRSGSTMLQKILGAHSEIYTRSEPWLMLHPLHALKSEHIQARYNASLAEAGVRDFISGLPEGGESFYYQRLRECYLSIYEPYLQSSGKSRFLDKTPRYYEIFDELQHTFPNAKFIILYRNPLAVLNSILETWIKGRFELLKNYKGDLEQGVEFLSRDFSSYSNTYCIRYEELLSSPEEQTRLLFDFLQLDFDPECIHYGKAPTEQWLYGDPKTVYEKSSPDAMHADGWLNQLSNPESYTLISDYLRQLGKNCVDGLGYDFNQLEALLKEAGRVYSHSDNTGLLLRDQMRSERDIVSHIKKQNLSLNKTIQELQATIQSIEEHSEESKTLLAHTQIRLEESNELVLSKDFFIKDLKALVDIKDLEVEECQKALIELREIKEEYIRLQEKHQGCEERQLANERNLSEKNRLLADKEERLLSAERMLEVNRKKLDEFASTLAEQNSRVAGLEASRIEANNLISGLQHDLAEKDARLKCLQDLVAEQEEQLITSVNFSAEINDQLAVLMSSINQLKLYRAFFSPKSKLNAYRKLLETNNAIAKMRNAGLVGDMIAKDSISHPQQKMKKSTSQE